MAMKICHASIDERGKGTGGVAGDQTGKEVCVKNYSAKSWTAYIKCTDKAIAKKAAKIAKKLAESNLVGYDMNQRNTLYSKLKKYNWNVDAYIASGEKSETDCSAFMYAVYCCLVPGMRYDTNAPTTSSMPNAYRKFGFYVAEGDSVPKSDKFEVGDVLVVYNESSHHTVMIVEVDTPVVKESEPVASKPAVKVEYYPKCASGYSSIVDALKTVGEKDTSLNHRKKIAEANGISSSLPSYDMNTKLLIKLKSGKLIKA